MSSCEKLPDYCVIAVETVVGLSEDALLHLLLLRRCHLLVLGNDQVSIETACLNCFGSVMEGGRFGTGYTSVLFPQWLLPIIQTIKLISP